MALAAIDRETEVTYIRRERDWLARAHGRGPLRRPVAAAADAPAGDRRRADNGGRTAMATGTATGTGTRRSRRSAPAATSSRLLAKLPQIILALIVMGAVLGIAALMLLALHQDWQDALLWILAAVMIGSGCSS